MKKTMSIIAAVLTSFVLSCQPAVNNSNNKTMEKEELIDFGKKYAAAWCSQTPGSVAAFFDRGGSLSVNDNPPAVGREAITKVAKGFMDAFPDMIVSMDSLVTTAKGIEFHWTLTGTNSGPGGTGNKVQISGLETWQISDNRLIQKSMGSFDSKEYNRQLEHGANN